MTEENSSGVGIFECNTAFLEVFMLICRNVKKMREKKTKKYSNMRCVYE